MAAVDRVLIRDAPYARRQAARRRTWLRIAAVGG